MNRIYNVMKMIAESYLSSVEQLANTIKEEDKYSRKYSAKSLENLSITRLVFGNTLYKKYQENGNMDTYAPVAVSALNLNKQDFKSIFKKWIADDETQEKFTEKLIGVIKKEYTRHEFKLGYNDIVISNLVFRTFDELCDFISLIYKNVKKLCKDAPEDAINWKQLNSKFKAYI